MTRNDTRPEGPATEDDDLTLGTVAQSHSQMDYVVEVYRERERERPPEKQDYEFGQPVYSTTTIRDEKYAVVGVVYDSQLVDPDQGREGPRLSTPDQEMFVPGYVDEKRTLLSVALLGYGRLSSRTDAKEYDLVDVAQEIPKWTLDVDDPVFKLSFEGFRRFHFPEGNLQLQYYDRLISTANRFGSEVTLTLIDHLRNETRADENMLNVIEQKVRWEAKSDRGVVR